MRLKLNYIIIPLFTIALAYFGGQITSTGMEWYKTINLPAFTPPGYIIGAVWTFIFLCATISAIIIWNKLEKNNSRFIFIIIFFIINGGLNFLWSYIFFGQHLFYPAIIEAAILGFSVLVIIASTWSVSRLASILLFPYFVWVTFATYLTYSIWLLNK
ncbi:tryptophan-rich sensory protein [Candidatus Parcubacteria bacterium]|nr:tryptophan-rich sensory protein [Patescibacteria group bacterium]MCG2694191.1 tryptophan-rich sensory protein [Candidatus Parcubacteria bacterium]